MKWLPVSQRRYEACKANLRQQTDHASRAVTQLDTERTAREKAESALASAEAERDELRDQVADLAHQRSALLRKMREIDSALQAARTSLAPTLAKQKPSHPTDGVQVIGIDDCIVGPSVQTWPDDQEAQRDA